MLLRYNVCTWWAGCAPTWTEHSDTRMDGGTTSSAPTVPDCLHICYHNAGCTAVDWFAFESVPRKCWLHGSWSRGPRRTHAGVLHFSISRPPTCSGNRECCFVYHTFIANSSSNNWQLIYWSLWTRAKPSILFGLNSRPNSVFVFGRIILLKVDRMIIIIIMFIADKSP